jgi:hypothetical protein
MTRVIMLLLLFVIFQLAKSQTITTLAPQSNCPSNFYFDYIANAKIQQKQLIVSGELVASGDSILQIVFSIEKPIVATNKSIKENINCEIEKVKKQQEKNVQIIFSDKTKKLVEFKKNYSKTVGKSETTVYINLLENPTIAATKKKVDLILVCTAIHKNGCRFIRKQNISFGY